MTKIPLIGPLFKWYVNTRKTVCCSEDLNNVLVWYLKSPSLPSSWMVHCLVHHLNNSKVCYSDYHLNCGIKVPYSVHYLNNKWQSLKVDIQILTVFRWPLFRYPVYLEIKIFLKLTSLKTLQFSWLTKVTTCIFCKNWHNSAMAVEEDSSKAWKKRKWHLSAIQKVQEVSSV